MYAAGIIRNHEVAPLRIALCISRHRSVTNRILLYFGSATGDALDYTGAFVRHFFNTSRTVRFKNDVTVFLDFPKCKLIPAVKLVKRTLGLLSASRNNIKITRPPKSDAFVCRCSDRPVVEHCAVHENNRRVRAENPLTGTFTSHVLRTQFEAARLSIKS